MVFGTVVEVSKGVRGTVRGVACLAADRGALSSRDTRCFIRAHQEALHAREFLGVLSLVAARERACCLIRRRRLARHPVAEAAQRIAHTRPCLARTLNRARVTHPSRLLLMRNAPRFDAACDDYHLPTSTAVIRGGFVTELFVIHATTVLYLLIPGDGLVHTSACSIFSPLPQARVETACPQERNK